MKIPFPRYDEALVLEIEEHLLQDLNTDIRDELECNPDSDMAGLKVTFAHGGSGVYRRPMFQVLNDVPGAGTLSGALGVSCACGDFSRSWNCSEHGEVPWDWEKRQFVTPGTSTRPRPTPAGTSTRPGEEIPLTLAGQVVRYVPGCPCPMCDPGAPVALARRPGHRRLMGLDRINADDVRRALEDASTFSITVEGVFDEGVFSYEMERDDPF